MYGVVMLVCPLDTDADGYDVLNAVDCEIGTTQH